MEQAKFISYCFNHDSPILGSALGPIAFKQYLSSESGSSPNLSWDHINVVAKSTFTMQEKMLAVASTAEQLACHTLEAVKKKEKFLVMGGDHTAAIGTWSGVSAALGENPNLGLIWIDAHMDCHTPQTTISGNIHGMPLAALLGFGDSLLTHTLNPSSKVKPENVCLIGVRSFEEAEQQFIANLGVRVYYIEEVKQKGFNYIYNESIRYISGRCPYYGISLDLDVIDPQDAPGVSVPVNDGLQAKELLQSLVCPMSDKFLGLEIVEFNPLLDVKQKTLHIVDKVINNIFSF